MRRRDFINFVGGAVGLAVWCAISHLASVEERHAAPPMRTKASSAPLVTAQPGLRCCR
jgi:hypothetical protein